jgi:hypothetical protein
MRPRDLRSSPASAENRGVRPLLLALLAVAACLTGAASATAAPKPDSDAPRGASADWLPADTWVMQRWLPFDEQRLESALGLTTHEIFVRISASRETLNALARSRGVSTRTLATRLLASRHLKAGGTRRATLLARTRRVLDQSHLAAHMLGHVFHLRSVIGRPEQVFGVSMARFRTLYFHQHRTFAQIAAAGGTSEAKLRARALAASRAAGRAGVAAGAMSARENRILRARDAENFPSWAGYFVPRAQVQLQRAALVCHLPPRLTLRFRPAWSTDRFDAKGSPASVS